MSYHDTIKHVFPPFDHQKRGIDQTVDALLHTGYHALFMEMGTGKTKTTINTAEILLRRGSLNALIIICPKALMSTWEDELAKHMRHTPYEVHFWDPQKAQREKWKTPIRFLLNCPKDQLPGMPIFVVNVEAFSRKNDVLHALLVNWYKSFETLTVLDESTFIKTPTSNRTKSVINYASQSKYRMILTGSEITNSVLDLYSQFEFLRPGFWEMPNFTFFKARYAIMEDVFVAEGRRVQKVVGFRRVEELLNRVGPHCFRALKRDCLDLPEKIYATIHVEMNAAQKRVYNELKEELWTQYKGQVLSVPAKVVLFMRFRQITGGFMPETGEPIGESNPKLDALIADVESYRGKVIIWSSFRSELKALTEELTRKTDYEAVSFFGDTSAADCETALRRFKDDPEVKFLVINPATGAFGLNLQHATLQYNFSRSLSPEKNWQAEDRSHRIGTMENVTYKDLVCPGTIDERILSLLERKTDVREKFQTGTVDDILEMV